MKHIKLFEGFSAEEFMTPAEFGAEIDRILTMSDPEAMIRATKRLVHDHPYTRRQEIADLLGCPYPAKEYLTHTVRLHKKLEQMGGWELKELADRIKAEIEQTPSMWAGKMADAEKSREEQRQAAAAAETAARASEVNKALDDFKSGAITKDEVKAILRFKQY